MTIVKMKAVDTLHVSAAGPENIAPGATFEVNETEAKQLEDRGLATRVGGKAEPAPANKMADAPANKAEPISANSVKAPARRVTKAKK